MPLERTPKYDAEIEGVRKMPQETPKQKAEKKDAAKLLRMEALFDNAQCAQFYVQHILTNPTMTREEFLYDAQQLGNIVHPEATEAFIDKLVETRSKIIDIKNWSYEKISDEDFAFQKQQLEAYVQTLHTQGHSQDYIEKRYAEKRQQIAAESEALIMGNFDTSHWLGQQLFRKHLANSPEPPKGEIKLDTSNPLALIMNFSDKDDYKRIDPKDNVGGFHRAEQTVDTFTFPLIAINAEEDRYVEQHEIGHAENSVLKNTAIKAPDAEHRRLVWSHAETLSKKEIDALNSETPNNLDAKEKQKIEAERKRLEDRLLSFALGRAKDELLANYSNTPDDPFLYKETLLNRKDLYDYFKIAGISEEALVYARLWREYERELFIACAMASYVASVYHRKKLNKRYETFRWVLAQIPLEDWEKQLEDTLFEQEAELLTEWNEFEYPVEADDDFVPSAKRQDFLKHYYDFLKLNQRGHILPELRKFKKEAEAIMIEEAENERKRPDEALMKIWEELEEYEAMVLQGVRDKTKKLYQARNDIEEFFYRRCDEENIEPNKEFFASYLEDHNWNSNIMKIRKDKLPGWEMYTSL